MRKPRVIYLLVILLVGIHLVLMNACTFRISDRKARTQFETAGVELRIHDLLKDDRKLHYVETGEDSLATLFFVHGSPGSWDDFSRFARDSALRAEFHIVSIDRPGFGHSDFGDAMNLEDQARMITPLIQYFDNGKPFYLIGHSLGGPLVALLAAEHPERIDGIVILAGAMDPSLEPKERWRYVMDIIPLRYFLPGAFRPSNKELIYLKKDLVLLKEKLSRVRCDVYILHGNEDMFVDPANVQYMREEFVHARSVQDTIYANENHFLPWTRFEEIKALLQHLPCDAEGGR